MIDPKVFKQVRKRLGLSQQELADCLGLSRVTVNKMERGRLARGIPDEIAERLVALKPRPVTAPRHKLPHYGDRQRHDHLDPETNARLEQAFIAEDDRRNAAEDDAHLWDNEEDDQ
jgi:transcriptional regulator with XRE-family HTH domain